MATAKSNSKPQAKAPAKAGSAKKAPATASKKK